MSEILVPTMYGLAGVSGFAALHHGLAAARRPADRLHLLFALLCVAALPSILAKAGAYQAHTGLALIEMRRWELGAAMAGLAVLPWFIADYTGLRPRRLLLALSTGFGVLFVVNQLLPHGISFAELPEPRRQTLPWGEIVTDVRVRERGAWHGPLWALVLFTLGWSLHACAYQYAGGARRRALALALGLGLFLVLVLINLPVNLGFPKNATHTSQFGMIALIVTMSLELSREHRQVRQRLQAVLDQVLAEGAERRKIERELHALCQRAWHADRVERTAALAASLAHELAQPLTAIQSNAQAGLRFLARDAADPDEIRAILQDIVRDNKRAAGVINGLRAMLRRQETPREPIDLGLSVREVIDLMRGDLAERGVVLEHALASQCQVTSDKGQIQQVMLNLMANASEAMAPLPAGRRRMWVSVSRVGHEAARVAVRDSGPPTPPEALAQVFDSFYTTKPQGLGMGLAVCRSILEAHGGSIEVEQNDDQGLTFFFTLPLTRG